MSHASAWPVGAINRGALLTLAPTQINLPSNEPQTLHYGARSTCYQIAETNRLRSKIRIHVSPAGRVEVQAPRGTEAQRIKDAVQKRARWIFSNLDSAETSRVAATPRAYVGGETHFYLGRRYRLKVSLDIALAEGSTDIAVLRRSAVKISGGSLVLRVPNTQPSIVKLHLTHWYLLRAKSYFTRRLAEIACTLDWLDAVPTLKLIPMRQQWGSCTPVGVIHLNPALIRAPRVCIDYVLLHELCHVHEHNHSKRFYALLSKYCPNWQETKLELDKLAELLLVDSL